MNASATRRSQGISPRRAIVPAVLLLGALVLLASLAAPVRVRAEEPTPGALAAIDGAVASGEISEAEGLLWKVRFVKGATALPKRFEGTAGERIKCGTPVLLEAMERLPLLPADIRAEILTLVARPPATDFVDTAHFRVHYDTSGPNMIYGWPNTAYRDSVLAACEKAWHFYHVVNSWQQPPSDGTSGGNGLIDCYVTDAGGAYGYTQAETPAARWPNDWTAFFVVDHAYDPPFPYADRTLPLKVTVAHEYHHVIQMGYTVANSWWMENVSTYNEDEVYDAINDNYQYLYYYTNFPYQRLSTFNGSHEYGCFIWPTLLKETHYPDVVRQVYECTASGTAIYACFDNALAQFGTGFAATLAEWGVWNFYTGARDDGHHYAEGGAYPYQVAPDQQFSTYPQLAKHPSAAKRPEPTGQSVIRLVRNTSSPDNKMIITFDGPACINQVVFVTKEAGAAVFHEYYLNLDAAGNGTLEFTGWAGMEYGHLLVQMSLDCPSAQDYVFDAVTTASTDVEHPPLYTRTVRLDQNEPNPFGPETRINYELPGEAVVRLAVYDAGGRLVRNLLSANQPAGSHQVRWDGRDDTGARVAHGVYYYRLEAGRETAVRKLVVME